MPRAIRKDRSFEPERARQGQRLDKILDGIVDHAILLLSRGGYILDCNRATESVLGWPPEELIDQHVSRFFPDDGDRSFSALLCEAAEQGRSEQEFWNRRRDGTRFWAKVCISRLVEQGRLSGFAATLRDMSDYRRLKEMLAAAEERLKESERRARLMMDSSVDGIVTTDEAGVIESFSGAAARMFGYDPEEVIGQHFTALLAEPYRGQHGAHMHHYLAAGGLPELAVDREVQGLRSDGTVFPIDLAVSEVALGGGQRRYVATVRDLSERKETERLLRQAQKMEAVGQLTGGLAHDFNNLLSVTLGSAELLKERLGDDERAVKLCATIIEAGRRGAGLTQRLLAFSRRQTLEPTEVDLAELVAGLRDLLARTLGDDIEVSTSLAEGVPPALADPAQLENAVLNLAINARDAMPKGGQLMISVDRAHLDERYVRQNPDAVPGDYVLLSVSDTGTGMPKPVLDRAFDPFFTTKPPGKGTGLGLSMVYGFAKQSGGHVKISSEIGVGTTVRLYLPIANGAGERAAAPSREGVDLPRGRETVLVVEDDSLVRDYVSDLLVDLGYTAIAMGDGAAALAELEKRPGIDLLFTDVVLPGGMNGHELSERARRLRPHLKVLFTTGYTEDAMVLEGKLPEGAQLIQKPYGQESLAWKLRAVIDGAPRPRRLPVRPTPPRTGPRPSPRSRRRSSSTP